jgi:hypothetical protein
MNSLVRTLGRFVTRDIPYIIGGLSIMLALWISLGLPVSVPSDTSTAVLLAVVGVAHPIGYVVQEAMSLTPLVNTSYVVKKNGPLLRWCFQRWERAGWSEKEFDAYAAYLRMYRGSPKVYAPVERILFLQHIGSAIGSSWLVCTVLLAISGLITAKYRILGISGVAGALSLLLLLTSQLQGMQLHLTLFRLEDERTKRRAQRESKGESALSPLKAIRAKIRPEPVRELLPPSPKQYAPPRATAKQRQQAGR